MTRVPVESSDLSEVEYAEASMTLCVWFHGGGVYEYYGIPKPIYDGLLAAPSKGKYFYLHIKKMGYQYKKLS